MEEINERTKLTHHCGTTDNDDDDVIMTNSMESNFVDAS